MDVEAHASVDEAVPIHSQNLTTARAPDLAETLRTRGTAVFEEQVVRSLLEAWKLVASLRAPMGSWMSGGTLLRHRPLP